MADGRGDLDTVVETALIEQLGSGHGALHEDAVAARMAIMRDKLAPCGSSPLEVLLAGTRSPLLAPRATDGAAFPGVIHRCVGGAAVRVDRHRLIPLTDAVRWDATVKGVTTPT